MAGGGGGGEGEARLFSLTAENNTGNRRPLAVFASPGIAPAPTFLRRRPENAWHMHTTVQDKSYAGMRELLRSSLSPLQPPDRGRGRAANRTQVSRKFALRFSSIARASMSADARLLAIRERGRRVGSPARFFTVVAKDLYALERERKREYYWLLKFHWVLGIMRFQVPSHCW